jgi:hypothetical protein
MYSLLLRTYGNEAIMVYLIPSRVVANVDLDALLGKRQLRVPLVEGLQGPLPEP